jgi:hypothetical protein
MTDKSTDGMVVENVIGKNATMLAEMTGQSVLLMEIIDEHDNIVEQIVCDSISGGADYVEGMPRRLTLIRAYDQNKLKWAQYEFVGLIDVPVSEKKQKPES